MIEAILQSLFIYFMFLIFILMVYLIFKRLANYRISLVVLLSLVLSPLILYVPIEIKTLAYGREFSKAKFETGFNLPVIYYRIFSLDNKSAKMFVVEGKNGKHETGTFYYFHKVDGEWRFSGKYDTVWSNLGGSASDFTLPPYF